MKALQLINRAYNLSGIVPRELSQVQGDEGADGLFLLNQLVGLKSDNGDYLPYYGRYEFVMVPGQQEYLIPDFVTIDTATYFINAVRLPLLGCDRRKFFGSAFPTNIQSLPFQYYYERGLNGMNIFFQFKPSQNFPAEVVGLKSLPVVTATTDFDLLLSSYYQTFLLFELAEYICMWNQISLPPKTQQKLDSIRNRMFNLNPKDYRINKTSMLKGGGVVTLGVANLSNGWLPA